MRWPVLIISAFAAAGVQMSAGKVLEFPLFGGASLSVDFLALLMVFVTITVRSRDDALWAAWLTGLLIDLSVTAAPIGLNALCFTAAAAAIYNFRAMVFTDSPVTQAVLTFLFCCIAHGLARLYMNIRVRPDMAALWSDMLQVLATAAFSALAAPLVLWMIKWLDKYLLAPSARRRGR